MKRFILILIILVLMLLSFLSAGKQDRKRSEGELIAKSALIFSDKYMKIEINNPTT